MSRDGGRVEEEEERPTEASGEGATRTADVKIELVDISQDFPTPNGRGVTRVFESINLTLSGPGLTTVVGPSGCGKTTLLSLMGGVRPIGLQTPTSGTILIDGEEVGGPHDDVVTVFQRYLNRPDLTVRQNVALPFRFKLWKQRVESSARAQRVDDAIAAVGLMDHAGHRPGQLSGGQNQRVALARALVLRPRILLADEPFGALDAQIRSEMQTLLLRLIRAHPCRVVFVTHDIGEALLLGDEVVVLAGAPSTIVDIFSVEGANRRAPGWTRTQDALALQDRVLCHLGRGAAELVSNDNERPME